MPNDISNKTKLLSIGDAAVFLGLSVATLRRWDAGGKIVSVRPNGKDRFFRVADLEKIKFTKPFSISKAADVLELSPTTLRRYEKKGLIVPERDESGERLYSLKTIQDFQRQVPQVAELSAEREILEDANEKILESDLFIQQAKIKRTLLLRGIFIDGALSLLGTYVLIIMALTIFFMLFPSNAIQYFSQNPELKPEELAQVLGTSTSAQNSTVIVSGFARLASPISNQVVSILEYVDKPTHTKIAPYFIEKTDSGDFFTLDKEGNIVPLRNIKLSDASLLQIENKNGDTATLIQDVVNQVISKTTASSSALINVDGLLFTSAHLQDGSVIGGVGGSILDGSINAADIADGSITDVQIASNAAIADSKLGTISIASKVLGSAVQLLSTGGLVNDGGLSLRRSCSSGQILSWDGDSWECSTQSSGSGGDVTGVGVGTGLSGGGSSGDVTLTIDQAFSPTWTGSHTFSSSLDAEGGITFGSALTTCTALETVGGVLTCGSDDSSGGISGAPNFISKFATGTTLGNSVLYELSNRIGIGTTVPAYTLDVNGSINIASGSTLKINGSDILSSSGLGAGVTASSLTSVGTLGSVSVSGVSALNGGVTFDSATDTISAFTLAGTQDAATNIITNIGNAGTDFTGAGGLNLAGLLTAAAGVSVNSETVTDLSGNGIVVTSNALGVNLTSSGTTGSTSSNSGLEVGAGGLTLLKGCTDGELLKYTDAGGWACATDTDTDTNTGNISGFTDFGSIVALTTTADNLGVGTSSPTNKLSVLGNADISGNLGVGTTSPAFKLDVAGSANISSGSTYKINGTDVLSASALGVGVTASSLTSVGTLGNLTVTGAIVGNGGLTLATGQTFTVNGDAFTDLTGNGLAVSGNALVLALTSSGTTGSSSSNSGLEVGAGGLTLLKGCTDGELLKYTDAGGWACATDTDTDTNTGNISGFTDLGALVALTTSADNLGVGTSSPSNKLSVLGNADVSGNLGVGITIPGHKLDVVGNVNVSSGSTYKVAGTDVLSGNTLGAGITASSLTSVGTLTNLGVGNSGAFGGGILVGGSTLTSFVGNGVTLSSGALTVGLTASGNTGSTSSNSGLEVGSAGLTLLKGCTDGELLKYTDAGGWACAADTDTDTNTGNISGFTDFGSIVALTTTADNLGVGTSSPTNKLSVVGSADISGNLGIGTTTPAFKLDIAGSTNLSASNTYKINGTDVLSGSALGVGVTASSLTSVGTLGNLTVTGTIVGNGGLTLAVGQTLNVNSDAITDLTGNGIGLSSNALTLVLTTSGNTGSTSSNSGLEVGSTGLTLLKGCTDGELLKYTDAGGWACATDTDTDTNTGNISGFADYGNTVALIVSSDNLGVGTSSPSNKLSVLGNADVSGNFGIGITIPGYKLDVAGSANLSTGNTYKIAGTDVLSSNTLGAGITLSSLTSVGTLTNLGVGSSGSFGGGLLVGGQTLTSFIGNGVTLSSGALTVGLTSSGNTGSTSSNSGLEVGSAGLTLLKGCTDGELLKYTDAGGWACAADTDTDTNTGNISGFTDFGSIVALTTTADNLGVGTSSPTNKLSVLGTADISGNLGIGTTTPAFKLDVAGSANLSSGSIYKINGTDVLSLNTLGSGVTTSSLTSVGTLTNLGVGNSGSFGGGLLVGGQTLTNFTGNGVTLSSGALTLALSSSGNSGSTSSNSGLEVGSAGLTLLKGCTDGELLKYTDAGGWACATDTDTDTNTGNISGFTDFGSIVALTTTADNLGVGTSSPTNKLSVLGTADISGNLGVGVTTPAFKLDVAGSTNLSSGSTYKINGTDVLSGSALGVGVTASSLTSVGTLGNLTVTGAIVGNGGLTLATGQTFTINGDAITDLTGNGIVVSGNALTIGLTSSGNTGSTSSNSGLEVGSAGLTLLKGCTDGELLKYTDAGGWACAADTDTNTGNISGFTDFGSIVALTTTADNLGVGTSSPTNKLSVVGTADISGNLGVGTTTPAFKLDVAGSTNLSSGSTYKINGTDVISGSGLGVGVTASSLTSLGTLGNVTVTGTSALNGGITFDSAADTISAFTLAGAIDAATNLITNIGNAGTDFIAGGGLTLAGAFTANSTAALNAAVTLGDASSDTVTSNAGVWSFTNATTVDLADSSRGALNFEGGLLALDTLNSRIGIGTTTPTQKLDVVGNVNVSSGSTYKIAGTDVLSGSTLGSGITASSLTSVGTLTNLGVGNSGSFGGGLLVGGETLTDFTGNGITLSSGALTLALTTSGNTGSTSSNSGLEVGSAGLTLLKGCTDGELLKYTDASGWACAADTDTNTGNVSGFTDFGSIVALTTTADNLGVGTSSPTNKLSVVGTADISGNLGIGTTTPAYKLDVAGSANLSTGSIYKINGTDVLSGTSLGVGVTASSLTSLGTLGNVTVRGTSALNGGITFDNSTDTISAFTLAGAIDAATNLITNIGDAGTDFIAGGGLNLAGVFTANSTTALNGATTFGDNAADTVTSNAGVWSFTNATTVDIVDSSRGALNFESGLLALDTLNSRIGIGTTTPTQKLDVAGNVNVSSGSTYKVAGTDVLSGTTLGSGITISSLTSVGTLTNLGVGNSGAFGGGLLVGGETVTDFTGNGVTLSSGALTVALTASGNTGASSSNSGLEVGSAGLTLLKGCADNELLKYTDAGGWACAADTDTDTNTGNISGFTDFGSIVALTTTADNLGVGTSNPTNKLSVVGTADISGNLGIGTTTPGYKLDVAGSANLSTGSTYKINGTDVISASGLGVGVTASSLTSVGTLGNLTVTGLISGNGGLTLATGQTFTINGDAITDLTGNGIVVSGNALTIGLTSSGNTGSTSSNSGLEVGSAGLTLLKGCTDGELLKYTDAGGWACATDTDTDTNTGNISGFTDFGSIVALTTTADNLGVGTSSPTNKLSVVGTVDISGNLGVGTTTPGYKLDVVGSANLSTGSTYKINGTDVLSGSGLGVGVTASSLTSLGTLGNVTVAGVSALNGGITFDNSTDTISAFTLSGTQDAATNLLVNIGDNGTDFVAGGGLTLAGAFTANGASALNGAVTFGDATTDTVTSTAGIWNFASSTTVDLVNSAAGALNFEGGLLALDTANSRVGIGTSSPTQKLDVAGNVNVTSGSTYKIAGTDVLSGSTLGSGITASSLTSVGTLTNLGVGNSGAFGGGILVGGQTLTNFTGNGVTLSSGALTTALTASGNTGSTSSNSGMEVGSAGLTLLKGCADGELLEYTDAGGWACAVDDAGVGSASGFTDFGTIVALTTSADNLGVGTSSPMNKLSVLGTADISGNLGIGVTIPAYKLDVAGTTNLSTGSTYKINGTDVISGSGLGVGVTASSLTSLGTLGNVTVAGVSALNGGITFDNSTDTISAFTLSGTQDAATNLLANIGDNGTDFVAGGGLTLAGTFTANGASALNGAVTFGDATTDTVTSTAGIWNFASSTTVDLVNSAAGALNFEGGLLALDTANSRVGIGTSSPTQKLDVAGNVNVSSGSTYKIAGTDVLSGTTLGSGITISSLTSVGTLTNLGVGNSGSFGGGLLVGGETVTDFTGSGVTISSGALALALTSSGTTGSTSSSSGLEVGSGGLTLLKGCADGELLEYTDAGGWACATDDGAGSSTLQASYAGDANGSDVTISLSADDDSIIIDNPASSGSDSAFVFKISQSNVTAVASILDLVQSSNAANGVNLTANAIDTETGLVITSNALTTGRGLAINSSSTSFTGSLAEITFSGSDAGNTGSLLKLSNTGSANANTSLHIDHRATGEHNLAFRVDDQENDTSPFIIDGEGRVGIGTSSVEGSTERILQVGSATNRGNAAVYGDIITKGMTDITALSNIRDMYLYDTTADSDGGKWIDWATTDQLSWYTEALDDGPSDPCDIASDDRCYTSSFPRKALIVVTLDDLYIFDAATNDMWMKFSQNASGYGLGIATNNDISSVTALNGVIYVTTNGSANSGLYAFDFVNDRMWNIDGTDRSAADKGISQRNSAITYNSDNTTAFDLSVSGTAAEWEDLNDVSAVYVTGSSTAIAIGAATNTSPGSGQTFVGLATDSGLTVINMTAGKLLQYSDVTADDYTSIALTKRGRMYGLNTTTDQAEMWINFDTDKASEINGTYNARYDESVGPALWTSTPNIIAGAPDALEVIERGSSADDTSDILYVGHSLGLTEIHTHATSTNGWSKFFNTTRQTMFMPAAIDMALPMDDSSGTKAEDVSFNNTDMTLINAPTLGASGVRGKAITFNGTDEYMCSDADQNGACDVDTSFNMSTTGWTLSLWFKHSTSIAGVDMLFEKCVTTTPAQATGCVAAYMTSTGTIVVGNDDDAVWTQGSAYDITSTSSLTYNDNQWHQLIISRTNANDVDSYIDGNPLNLSTATGNTLTVDGSQIVTIGASCSTTTGAACAAANATNFWDGTIDDVTFSNGATTVAQFSALQARRFYNDARPLVGKRVITVDNADVFSTTTIGDTAEAWIPNEFAGLHVTITSGTGSGQTRRIIGNTTTTMTVGTAFSTTPDATSDFEVDPEALYGASDSVRAIGITGENFIGQARQMCVGTNDGSDGGGVTCYNHQAGPNIIADIFHGDTEDRDDYGAEWTGTDYDDIRTIDFSSRALAIGSEAHVYLETEDVRLGQGMDYFSNKLFDIRSEMINDGIVLTGSLALEVGFTGGADLAERYYSDDPLEAGMIISPDATRSAWIKSSNSAYQKDVLGVVSSEPGLILGQVQENAYPIALVGRVPVKVTTENGPIKVGDAITSSSLSGYGMKAIKAGKIIGTALESSDNDQFSDCSTDEVTRSCGTVMVFVNNTNYLGTPIDVVLAQEEKDQMEGLDILQTQPTISFLNDVAVGKQRKDILTFLQKGSPITSEIFTDRVTAQEVIAPTIITDLLVAKRIKADSIEGLEIFTNKISQLETDLSSLKEQPEVKNASEEASIAITPSATPSASVTVIPATTSLLSSLNVEGEATVSGNISVWGDGLISGVLNILNSLTTKNLIVGEWADFVGNVILRGDVAFIGRPEFNKDSAGVATIKKDTDRIDVVFEKEYKKVPTVNITLQMDAAENEDGTVKDLTEQEAKIFEQQYTYFVTRKSKKGFTIIMNKKSHEELTFSWNALLVSEK